MLASIRKEHIVLGIGWPTSNSAGEMEDCEAGEIDDCEMCRVYELMVNQSERSDRLATSNITYSY